MTRDIHIIATGGTFDKRYQPLDGSLAFAHSHLPELLATARCEALVTELLQIDSLDMTDIHREQVLTACSQSREAAIVITHGTDTIVQTATLLAGADLNKTIVLTGAMVPVSVAGSDAPFNLGFAIAAARLLPAGVWVAMNGVARPWDDVRKDREAGLFTTLA